MASLNIFIDESGNFDFSVRGTKYFLLTAVSTTGCADLFSEFFELKHRLAASGLELEEFHATENKQAVRDEMYKMIERHCEHQCLTIDSVIAQKNKTNPSIRADAVFYAKMLQTLLQWVFKHRPTTDVDRILVWAARIGTNKKRGLFEKTIKGYLSNELNARHPYHLFIHSAASHPMLQVADYCSWAIIKKWKDAELRPYSKIHHAVLTEFEIFRSRTKQYY
ncbi:MAG TPA: DUF3800 domain-containing protein [Thermoanaerobaculia bacterium]|nr:DUF3800 domain-containing protein [Thermoanaerobaculia bacterium]